MDADTVLNMCHIPAQLPQVGMIEPALNGNQQAPTEPPKRKRGRPKKNQETTEVIQSQQQEIQPAEEDIMQLKGYAYGAGPYQDTYDDTNSMLRTSIMQIDILTNDVKTEIDNIKKSKTIKGKYKYMSDLCSTASNLVSTKLSAIKEMNSVITNCHKLEMQRIKDMTVIDAKQQNQKDDDKYISDLYNAYINTPINQGAMQNTFMGQTASNTIGDMNIMMNGMPINTGYDEQNYQNYLNNLTPEQNRMFMEGNPNIETVVVYDTVSGDKHFDVIDTSTGYQVPNYPIPDQAILDDTLIDFQSGIATNSNINQSWKVVIVNNPSNYC